MSNRVTALFSLLIGVWLSACAATPEPINRVQTNLVEKGIFQGEWWYTSTSIDVDFDEENDFYVVNAIPFHYDRYPIQIKTGELVRITAPVSRDLEITEIADRVMKGPADKNKALLFENVPGFDMPVAINLFGSDQRMAAALGVDDLEDLNHRLAKVVDFRLPQGLGPMLDRAGDLLGVLRGIGLGPTIVFEHVGQASAKGHEEIL